MVELDTDNIEPENLLECDPVVVEGELSGGVSALLAEVEGGLHCVEPQHVECLFQVGFIDEGVEVGLSVEGEGCLVEEHSIQLFQVQLAHHRVTDEVFHLMQVLFLLQVELDRLFVFLDAVPYFLVGQHIVVVIVYIHEVPRQLIKPQEEIEF